MSDFYKKNGKSASEEDFVEALLSLPSKNLESRIKGIQSELHDREKMRNHVLTKLETHKAQLKNHKERLKYATIAGQSPAVLQSIASDLLKIDSSIANELKDCFRDMSRLKERLQDAREEFEIEKKKLAMISTPENQVKNDNYRRNRRPPEKTEAFNGRKD